MTNDSTYASTSEILILEKPAAETASIYYGTVTVKVWLEGTDGDCLNSIFEDKMTVMLNLTGIMKSGFVNLNIYKTRQSQKAGDVRPPFVIAIIAVVFISRAKKVTKVYYA